MTAYNKDFVVKNGLVVGNGAAFGDTITINGNTVATQSYVQSSIANAGIVPAAIDGGSPSTIEFDSVLDGGTA